MRGLSVSLVSRIGLISSGISASARSSYSNTLTLARAAIAKKDNSWQAMDEALDEAGREDAPEDEKGALER
jgi:hypothetical protein